MSSLKQRIRDGEIVVALRVPIQTQRAALEEALSKGSYDLIYIDGQHAPFEVRDALPPRIATQGVYLPLILREGN